MGQVTWLVKGSSGSRGPTEMSLQSLPSPHSALWWQLPYHLSVGTS